MDSVRLFIRKQVGHPPVFPHYRKETQQLRLIGDLRDTDFPDKVDEFIRRCDINVFINNAGVHLSKSPRRTTDEEVDEVIGSNLTSQIKVLNRVYNYFVEKNDGMIININSLCVRHPSPTETVYCEISKFGLLGFSKKLQIDVWDETWRLLMSSLGSSNKNDKKQR